MSIFCWKQLKCFHVGQCLGQEKHHIFMKDTGEFSLIVLIQKWKEKRKTNIRKPLRVRLLTKFIFVRIWFPVFFLLFLLNRALLNFRPFTLSSFFNTIKCRCDNTIKIVFLSSFISASVFNEQRNVYTGYHHLRRNLQIKLKRKFLCTSSFSRWTVASKNDTL